MGRFADATAGGLGAGLVFDDHAKTELVTLDNIFEQTYAPFDRGYAPGRTPKTRIVDVDNFPSAFLEPYEYVIERRLGGLSLPAAAVRARCADRRLPPLAPPGRGPAAGPQAGRAARPRGRRGRRARARASAWPTRRGGACGRRAAARRLVPAACATSPPPGHVAAVGRLGRHPLRQHRPGHGTRHVRPRRPARRALPRQRRSGRWRRSFRLLIDGQAAAPPVVTRLESRDGGQFLGTLELAPGRHRIELWSPEQVDAPRPLLRAGRVAGARAAPPPASAVCVNGRRYEAAWDRPGGDGRGRRLGRDRELRRRAAVRRLGGVAAVVAPIARRRAASGGASQRSRMPSWKRRKAGSRTAGWCRPAVSTTAWCTNVTPSSRTSVL